MPESQEPAPNTDPLPAGFGGGSSLRPELVSLTHHAFQLRSQHRHALHPIEAALQYHRASPEGSGAACDVSVGFEQAEGIYRTGAQGLRRSESPPLAQQLRELSRLSAVDRAGRKALRKWAIESGQVLDESDHDENVVRLPETGELAVIDPYISLARRGTWAAIKLAEIGFPTPDDDPLTITDP